MLLKLSVFLGFFPSFSGPPLLYSNQINSILKFMFIFPLLVFVLAINLIYVCILRQHIVQFPLFMSFIKNCTQRSPLWSAFLPLKVMFLTFYTLLYIVLVHSILLLYNNPMYQHIIIYPISCYWTFLLYSLFLLLEATLP